MSSLILTEKTKLERLFDMSCGYVLNFSDNTLGAFFAEFDIDIHSNTYQCVGTSKAKKLRAFWTSEPDHVVGQALLRLIDHPADLRPNMDDKTKALSDHCREIAKRLLGATPSLTSLKERAVTFNAVHLADQIRRMESSIQTDPALAIGTAKELIETCCKTILAERGKPVKGTPEVSTLTKDVLKELKLVPEGVSDASRGSDVIKGVLRSLGSIGNDLAQLRGLYGTGHGKHGQATGLSARHARLAVGAAATFCTFIFETHQESKPNTSQLTINNPAQVPW